MKKIFNILILVSVISMILYIGKEYKFYHDNNKKIKEYKTSTTQINGVIDIIPERKIK